MQFRFLRRFRLSLRRVSITWAAQDSVDRFDAWVLRIVVNQCQSVLRSRRRHRVREIDVDASGADAIPAPGGGEGDAIADSDAIRRAFQQLTADQRALIVLYYVEDRPIHEVAGVLGVADGTVKWRLYRARAALANALAREER